MEKASKELKVLKDALVAGNKLTSGQLVETAGKLTKAIETASKAAEPIFKKADANRELLKTDKRFDALAVFVAAKKLLLSYNRDVEDKFKIEIREAKKVEAGVLKEAAAKAHAEIAIALGTDKKREE